MQRPPYKNANCLSPAPGEIPPGRQPIARLATLLNAVGHDTVAVRDLGIADASDDEVLERASSEGQVLVSHDTDLGTLLAFRRLTTPSLILFRSSDPITPDQQAELIIANLTEIADDLEAGATSSSLKADYA